MRKKILPERSEGGDFFSANPQGTALSSNGLFQKFANQKAGGTLIFEIKALIESYKVAGRTVGLRDEIQLFQMQGSG